MHNIKPGKKYYNQNMSILRNISVRTLDFALERKNILKSDT
jgi:hypothetical protein